MKRKLKKGIKTKKIRKIRKKKNRITCSYCQVFFDMLPKKRENGIVTRECLVTKDIVTSKTVICDDFIVSKYFYCSLYNYWLSPFLCLKRKERGLEKCQKCRLFDKEVSYVLEEWVKENALKRKLRKGYFKNIRFATVKKLKRRNK